MNHRAFVPLALAGCVHPPAGGAPAPAAVSAPLSLAADAQMVAISAGQYIAGSTPEERDAAYDAYRHTAARDTARAEHWFDGEEEHHVAFLPAFEIDLMPVTQAAYAEFVAAGQAPAPELDEAAWTARHAELPWSAAARFVWHDGRPPADRVEHPVVLVTYAEAARYCAWRGALAGQPRRLPTAAEYEKAARGDHGLAYPWGNEFEPARLDSAVGGPGDTEPVGERASGASPYGVLGLAGNALEWTSTPWKAGERTVKGSSWDDYGGVGRGASGHGRPDGDRLVVVGFRCAGAAP